MPNSNPLDISGDDISLLNDTDLRNLIGLLCEAEFRLFGLSLSGIRYGGNQDAKDGGIDVMIESESPLPQSSFICRPVVGIQVKRPDMSRGKIISEIRPEGRIRPAIKSLIEKKGGYIIISSGSNTTESTYKNRVDAIAEAIEGEEGSKNLKIDFFDRGRIATWVRSHPSLILWVRSRLGKAIYGWQPYGNWSKSPNGVSEEYILDDKLRIIDGNNPKDGSLSIDIGIAKLRERLRNPSGCVRLVGLSGVGKTRLVQALFDDRVCENPLDPTLAFYTDLSDGPQPDPKAFALYLSRNSKRAILIIDNCTQELHRKLTEACKQSSGVLSILTIEYDVRDDVPEETQVYKLQSASTEVIEKIILRRFPFISRSDLSLIADFSDGNARIALALANTMKAGETLSGFKDQQLFERLFWQGHQPDDNLLEVAETLSLLYSFDGVSIDDQSELATLSKLTELTLRQIFRKISILKERDLLQSRSKWRAILPHAIANRLAKRALETIPRKLIETTIFYSGNERLIKSFSRRISYLHDSQVAVELVSSWISKDGWLGSAIFNLSQFGVTFLKNVSPICPSEFLDLIESTVNDEEKGRQFTSRENKRFYDIVKILRHIAYDELYFERSILLIAKFAKYEDENEKLNSTRDCLKSLFFIHLSGTHTSLEVRANVVRDMLSSNELSLQKIGLLALEASLETGNFNTHFSPNFGARPRDYGYRPSSETEVAEWFNTFIEICTEHILSSSRSAPLAKQVLASNFSGLWVKAKVYQSLETSVKAIRAQQLWNEAWISSLNIFKYYGRQSPIPELNRLSILRKTLRPESLEGLTRAYVLSGQNIIWDLDNESIEDSSNEGLEAVTEKVRTIGSLLAKNTSVCDHLLPQLITMFSNQMFSLGLGYGIGSRNKMTAWNRIYRQVSNTSKENLNTNFIQGFLSACSKDEQDTCNLILDQLIEDSFLGQYLPALQAACKIDDAGLKRFHRYLDLSTADVQHFDSISYGRLHESINDNDLANLLERILKKQNGFITAVEILRMRFFGKEDPSLHSEALLTVGTKTLSTYNFTTGKQNQSIDYSLSEIAKVCLSNKEDRLKARAICRNLYNSFDANIIFSPNFKLFLRSLSKVQPKAFLDVFVEPVDSTASGHLHLNDYGLDDINDNLLIEWCEENPSARKIQLAKSIQTFEFDTESKKLVWRKIFDYLTKGTENLDLILDSIAELSVPDLWSRHLPDIFEDRVELLQNLQTHPNDKIRSWARELCLKIKNRLSEAIEWQRNTSWDIDESFE
ncbi:MAG: hypothetical protein AAF741_06090 [Bacteroidota bacterium]